MRGTLDAIRIVRRELESRDVPVIGFAGAPFTLASYAIEGGRRRTSRGRRRSCSRSRQPGGVCSASSSRFRPTTCSRRLGRSAGAAGVRLVGGARARSRGLPPLRRPAQPRAVREGGRGRRARDQLLARRGGVLVGRRRCGGDVVGLDWPLPLDEAWERVGFDRPVQGNLDPVSLLAPWRELGPRIDDVLDRAGGRPGHVFNVGHGADAADAGGQRPPARRARAGAHARA